MTLVAACVAVGCRHGGGGGPAGQVGAAAPAASAGSPIHGRVVDRQSRRPLAGRAVLIAGQRATTAADGTFSFAAAPQVYDAAVLDGGREIVTVYRGLSRRDPLLVHASEGPPDEWRAKHGAWVFGSFTREGRPTAATMAFFSPALAALGEACGEPASSTTCGRLQLLWNGAPSQAGDVVAVAIEDRGPRSADTTTSSQVLAGWAARRPLALAAAQSPSIDMALSPLPLRRVRGALHVPGSHRVTTLIESYRLPIPGADIPIRRLDTDGLAAVDDQVPDPRPIGGSLCVTAIADRDGTTGATRCDMATGPPTDTLTFSLTLDAPPRLTEPAHGAPFEPDTRFAWTRHGHGVHVLELAGPGSEAEHPRFAIFTSEVTLSWTALAGFGVRFPKGCSIYQVTVGGQGPYASLDDAVGPAGLGALIPAETRWSTSMPVAVTVPRWPRPAPGDSFAAKLCHYPYGQGIVCGPGKGPANSEYYMLSAINNKLRNFPELTRSIGIYCVHDCDTARRFMKAYADYSKRHPGFDDAQPLDMEPC